VARQFGNFPFLIARSGIFGLVVRSLSDYQFDDRRSIHNIMSLASQPTDASGSAGGLPMITLADAARIVDHALQTARSMNLPPMTIAVLDARGCLVAFKMEDGSSLLRENIARAKAWSALGMGMGTRSLMSRAAHHPSFFVSLASLAEGSMVPVPGGVLIRSQSGAVIGSVGVSGDVPDKDEACAVIAIGSVDLLADPGTA
jgi:uncharacterized protein GlcG (DUF336 family)